MAKQLSTARKFKMITGKDLFQQQKAMDTELKKEDGEITDVMEFVNIVKAKSDFSDFRSSFEFDTDGKGLKELVELWQKEI